MRVLKHTKIELSTGRVIDVPLQPLMFLCTCDFGSYPALFNVVYDERFKKLLYIIKCEEFFVLFL